MSETQKSKWVFRWKNWLAPTKVPGVWKRKEGGHFVRARITDPATGRMKEIKKSMPEADEAAAFSYLSDQRKRVQSGSLTAPQPSVRFADFAVQTMERKIAVGEIKSARTRERWKFTLIHLIAGTEGVTGFGELFVDHIRPMHIEEWRVGIGRLIHNDVYAPTTVNGWLAIFRVIMKAAKREFGLPKDYLEDVPYFDTSEHETYTEEQPNALDPAATQEFLACMKDEYPQHYAMTYLGFATGLRPSSMRPLRRNGPTPDILWDQGIVLVRRSHALGDEVMDTTKIKRRLRINVPADVIDVLRWHVSTQLKTPEQQASELLFPGDEGGLRGEHVLRKPFARVEELLGFSIHFTPRGLRRTFTDLARAVNIENVVTKSIAGRVTDRMHELYSTVRANEQREGIGRLLDLVKASPANDASRRGAPGGAPTPSSGAPKGVAQR